LLVILLLVSFARLFVAASYVTNSGKKTSFLGSFASEEEAARAHDKEEFRLYGKDARLNFPDDIEEIMESKIVSDVKKKKTSTYNGVSKNTKRGDWVAQFTLKRKHYHIGYFEIEEEAAHAYDEKLIELLGYEKAKKKLNFPSE
jgi:AP2 domain